MKHHFIWCSLILGPHFKGMTSVQIAWVIVYPQQGHWAKITKKKLNGCIETTENDHTYFQIVADFRACLEMTKSSRCFLCHQFPMQGSVSLTGHALRVTCQLFWCPPRPPVPTSTFHAFCPLSCMAWASPLPNLLCTHRTRFFLSKPWEPSFFTFLRLTRDANCKWLALFCSWRVAFSFLILLLIICLEKKLTPLIG